jgi:hypothetical protein
MTEPKGQDKGARMAELPERNRGRVDFSDPVDIAVEFGELRNHLALLQQQNQGAMTNLTSSIQAMQSDLRNIGRKVEEVTRLQIHQEQHSDGLRRAFEAISALTNTVERGFTKIREEQDNKRVEHQRSIDQDISNEKTRLDKIRDRVIWMSGGAAAISVVAGIAVAIVAYYTNRLETYATKERERTEQVTNDNARRVRNIEYYLSQGGNTPDRRYTPPASGQ